MEDIKYMSSMEALSNEELDELMREIDGVILYE